MYNDKYINKDIKNVYIHVGMHKTGTSSIQHTLYTNRDVLQKKHSVYYPKNIPENHSGVFSTMFRENPEKYHGNIIAGRTKEETYKYRDEVTLKLLDDIRNCKASSFIIIAEDISIFTEKSLSDLKSFFEFYAPKAHITASIMYRETISYINSAYQQIIKTGYTYKSITSQAVKQFDSLYYRRTKYLLDVFGKENIRWMKFETALKHENGLLGAYFDLMGLSQTIVDNIDEKRTNEGVSNTCVDMINFINSKVPFYIKNKKSECRNIKDTEVLYRIRGAKYKLSIDDVRHYLETNKDDIRWLKNEMDIEYTLDIGEYKESTVVFDENFYEDIINNFNKLNTLIKHLVYLYILQRTEGLTNNPEEECVLRKTLKWIEETNKKILSLNLEDLTDKKCILTYRENDRIYNHLNLSEKLEDADIFREIALMCEANNDMENAYRIMQKAFKLRKGPFIKEKLLEYEHIMRKI